MPLLEHEVFTRIGEDGFSRIAAEFYRQIPADDILGPMYPADDLTGAETRLRDFLIYRFGGPQKYIVERGHPRLRMRHAPFPIDKGARDRWMQLMNQALELSAIDPEARDLLRNFFDQMATFLINRQDPS
jgi:hemoglobin